MANEYRLSYTASEIDEKLSKIDSLVSSVNGILPDGNGNVEILVSDGSGNMSQGGISATASALLIDIMRKGMYTTDQSANITALAAALAVIEPEQPTVTLTSITATYSGGSVSAGTAVSDLVGLEVTAHYSDGTNHSVTDYTRTGTIGEGDNIITINYGGMTTTVVVPGVAESGGEESDAVVAMTTAVQHTNASYAGYYSDGGDTTYANDGRFPSSNCLTTLSENVFSEDTQLRIKTTGTGNAFRAYLFCSTLLEPDRVILKEHTDDLFFHIQSSGTVFAYGWSNGKHEFAYTVKAGYKFCIIGVSVSKMDDLVVEVV